MTTRLFNAVKDLFTFRETYGLPFDNVAGKLYLDELRAAFDAEHRVTSAATPPEDDTPSPAQMLYEELIEEVRELRAALGRRGEAPPDIRVIDVAGDGNGPWKLMVNGLGVATWPSKTSREEPHEYADEVARVLGVALRSERVKECSSTTSESLSDSGSPSSSSSTASGPDVARKESPTFEKLVDAVGPVDVSVLAQAMPYDSAPWGESHANDRWNLKGVSGALIDVGDVNVDDADYSKSIYELARQRDEARARSERAEMRKAIQPVPSKTSQDDLAEWRELAGVLRNHESHIQGILADVDWGSPDSMSQALEDIGDIINRLCPEGAKPNLSLAAETEIETPTIQPSLPHASKES